jgi:hypothetical protein
MAGIIPMAMASSDFSLGPYPAFCSGGRKSLHLDRLFTSAFESEACIPRETRQRTDDPCRERHQTSHRFDRPR